jgi:hypothetical protein
MNADAGNRMRWNERRPGAYEVWFLTWNHAASGDGFWLRYTLEAPTAGHGEPYAALWFARFARDEHRTGPTFAIHRRFPIAALRHTGAPFALDLAGRVLGSSHARGDLAGAGHDVRWDLRWPAGAAPGRLLPDVMYLRGGLGETTVLSPTVRAALTGELLVDGVRYELSGEPVAQTHLWGGKHAHQWAWARCLAFAEVDDAAFEVLSPRLRRRGVVLPTLTVATLRLGDELLAFNQFRHAALARARWDTGRYQFSLVNAHARLDGELSARLGDFVLAPYEDPDGEPSWCANTEIGSATLRLRRRRGLGWGPVQELTADGTAHFELADRRRDPAITTPHQQVP